MGDNGAAVAGSSSVVAGVPLGVGLAGRWITEGRI
jgi:hypothetical protein